MTHFHFWARICKTVRPMLSNRCVFSLFVSVLYVCLSICNVYVLWPNGWMDQGETWHGGRPRSGHILLDGDPAPIKKGAQPPIFGPCLLWPNGWMDQNATWYGGRPRPRRHCIRSNSGRLTEMTYRMASLTVTANVLDGHFGYLKPFKITSQKPVVHIGKKSHAWL